VGQYIVAVTGKLTENSQVVTARPGTDCRPGKAMGAKRVIGSGLF
jgi:hypothetical protein